MKTKITFITGILLTAITLFSFSKPTESQSVLPPATSCQAEYVNQFTLMRQAYRRQLSTVLDQEKPTSQKVDEAFETLRTYRCWLSYVCEAVRFSGNANPSLLPANQGLTSGQLPTIPGCAAPQNIKVPGAPIKYLSQCQVGNQASANLATINANYESCRSALEKEIGNPTGNDPKSKKQASDSASGASAFVSLEAALKTSSANQNGQIIGERLRSILNKTSVMENRVVKLREQIERFDSLLPCVISKCD